MNTRRDMDPMQMCRICAVVVDDDTASHPLIKNNEVTELGEKFISCLGIQLIKEGCPDRVCDYCQLQLNTFHAFVRKAKNTSTQFETMRKEQEQCVKSDEQHSDAEPEPEIDGNPTNSELIAADDVEFDLELPRDVELNETEYIVHKRVVKVIDEEDEEVFDIDEIEGEYTIEYLDPEYMNTLDDDVQQTENEEQSDGQQKKADKAAKSSDSRVKRTYPYKCANCNKRFVYKEVYEAHIRRHKGLPGFSCPHCPKTFNEKANFDYHMQDHTKYRPAKCHLCEKSFKNKQDLASHIRVHKIFRDGNIQLKTNLKDIRKYMCDVCGKRFRSQSHMTYHRYAHFEARNFPCDQCPQKFKSPHILRTHRNTVHSTVFRYECEQCGRKFKRDHHLVAHRKTHNKVPGSRKQRKSPAQKDKKSDNATQPEYEMITLIKDEALDISYEDDNFEEEFIAD